MTGDRLATVMMDFGANELLTRDECLDLLPEARIGRIGLSIGALPTVLPVNFVTLPDALLFRAPGDSKLFRASVGAVVAFEVDGYRADERFGWSVLVRGVAAEVAPRDERVANELWTATWPDFGRRDRFIAVPTTVLSGWRFPRIERTG